MNKDKLIYRSLGKIENTNGRTVEGYAVVFDSLSNYLGFFETIHRGAITNQTLAESDVFALFNHNENDVLARSNRGKGSLTLTLDNIGLKYSFDAPNTQAGNELLEHINRGEIEGSSFAFYVDTQDTEAEKWTKQDGELYRDIYKIAYVADVSPVYSPAYGSTTCSARAAEMIKKSEALEGKLKVMEEEIEELLKK